MKVVGYIAVSLVGLFLLVDRMIPGEVMGGMLQVSFAKRAHEFLKEGHKKRPRTGVFEKLLGIF